MGQGIEMAEMYENLDACRALAEGLRGFPTGKADIREFELGTFSQGFAGGGMWRRCYVLDSAGHSAIEVRIQNEEPFEGEARFHIPVEPAAIDSFVEQLEKASVVGDCALLEATA
jgi:hypothetical protein